MATITKSIKASGGDYTTIAAWEADLDDTGIYASGDVAIGECYNQVYNEATVTINGGGTVGLASRKLSVAVGNRHNGTAGTGARFNNNGSIFLESTIANTILEWLEVDGNETHIYTAEAIRMDNGAIISKIILHGFYTYGFRGIYAWGNLDVFDSIIYNLKVSYGALRALDLICSQYYNVNIYNSTIHNLKNDSAYSDWVFGIRGVDYNTLRVKNLIVTDMGGTSLGTKLCYFPSSPVQAVMDYNLSSDASAYGAHSLINKSSSNQYVSTVLGSEDLHLKAGADAINAGVDLGTTPVGVNIDIDGYDRDSNNVTWDMGADEVQTQTVTVDSVEGIVASEVIDVLRFVPGGASDGLKLSETISALSIIRVGTSDGLKLAETISALATIQGGASDGLKLSETISAIALAVDIVTDGSNFSDSPEGVATALGSSVDVFVLGDLSAAIRTLLMGVYDRVEIVDQSPDPITGTIFVLMQGERPFLIITAS